MLLSLTIIAVGAAAALAFVSNGTAEPIALAQKAKKEAAVKAVLPAFDRLLLMWDSREFDRDGGYAPIFNLSNPEDAEKIYTISNTDRDIAEN